MFRVPVAPGGGTNLEPARDVVPSTLGCVLRVATVAEAQGEVAAGTSPPTTGRSARCKRLAPGGVLAGVPVAAVPRREGRSAFHEWP